MQCYKPTEWQFTVHNNIWEPCLDPEEEGCDREEISAELEGARSRFLDCIAGCESQFCTEQCLKIYQAEREDIINNCLPCRPYENSGITCVPGSGDYDNADVEDNDTDDSICNHPPAYDFPVAGIDPYGNADVQPRGDDLAGDC